MIKFFTVVLTLCSINFAFADDYLAQSALKTKNLVRMKLWYDGIDQVSESSQNQVVTTKKVQKPLPEELERALDKINW